MPLSKKDIHVGKFFQEAKSRAKTKKVPFTITLKYLREIAQDTCPIFGHQFVWGRSGLGKGKTTGDSPSLDRIVPELGYVPGNVVFISHDANRIKSNATEKKLYAVADWLHDARKKVLNANKIKPAPVSTGADTKGEQYAKRRAIPSSGAWENYDHTYNHSRAIQWQDAHYRTQASSGDSVGRRDKEVGTSFTPESIQIDGQPKPKISWIKLGGGHLPDKP